MARVEPTAGVVSARSDVPAKAAVIERAQRHSPRRGRTTDFARISGLDEIDIVVMDESTPVVAELSAAHAIELVTASGGD
jgi:hypothetical protein